jgi:CRP-like cAMP-binding protein
VVVDSGFVIACAVPPAGDRRMILAVATCGTLLPAPHAHEQLIALTETRLILLDEALRRRLLELPGAAAAIVAALLESLRDRQVSLSHFATVKHVGRVREKLLQLGRAHGKVVNGGVRLDLPLTHELVAEMVGSARETVTWAFRELGREGLVVREGQRYRLAVSPERLND